MLCKNNWITEIYKSTRIKCKYFKNMLFLKEVCNFGEGYGFFTFKRLVSLTPTDTQRLAGWPKT